MSRGTNLDGALALDARGVDALRLQARKDPAGSVKAAAQQFEAVFMSMLLKSMREASPQGGMFDNEQSRQYVGMLDNQLAQTLSSRGLGLAEVMARQLMANATGMAKPASDTLPAALPSATPLTPATPLTLPARRPIAADAFMKKLSADAESASRATGIPAKFMIGQAALESGWGNREIRASDGTASHNLFGIKAGRNWKGAVVEATTTEYVNGVAQKKVEKFRAYSSYAEGFRDYANLIRNNPRYAPVLQHCNDPAAFAQAMQDCGYATDPRYAAKLVGVMKTLAARA